MRSLACLLALSLPSVGCYEPSIEGMIAPDANCEFSIDGELRTRGILDVGSAPQFVHSYEGVLLVDARPDKRVTSASVAFSSNGERLPNVTLDGETFVFPSVEGERHSKVDGTTNADGLAAVAFTLVTDEEALALQQLTTPDTELELLVELRAEVGGRGTTYPAFVDLRVCEGCLVGVGAELQGDELLCTDGLPPTPVSPAPCREGQDDLFSTCDRN